MEKGFTITYEYGDNLYVNPTNRCNFNCAFCLRHNQGSGGSIYTHNLWLKREPTKEEILASIESHDLTKYAQLVFCGFGEPIYTQSWPTYDENKLVADEVEIAVQIKGKVRGRIMVPATLGKDDGEKLLENETVKKLVGDAQVKKIIFVPGRLLNIVC